ncbi:hypothetical protein [Chryseobacterium sp. BIGb0232]|uniref:hypothetical protein n=1 Tax=Chryseobacterium sp. BIGb0232 TaxID=2940598 RepID=UPI000F475419|nr:hypothetical protein [Chryseobacterium sp. BIGb0232]MCS4301012.1 hypothetical protein [Chryseobacterium sp. BIGb0232]ROS20123.1 hypothetical protein EDF65_0825 [Chryseobacterium nakagawai]
MENITQENYSELLSKFINKNNLTYKKVSNVIGCSGATLKRLLNGNTLPTNEMIKQTQVLITIGFDTYVKLADEEKKNILEILGSAVGAGLGLGTLTNVVGGIGVAGLSGPGIMSGLAVLGSTVGAGAAVGIVVTAAIPFGAGAAGYGIIKGAKAWNKKYKNKNTIIDAKWEIAKVALIL